MQKYPHIIESYACILKIFVLMLLLCEAEDEGQSIMCSTQKESK